MRISDWSSDVCSSDLHAVRGEGLQVGLDAGAAAGIGAGEGQRADGSGHGWRTRSVACAAAVPPPGKTLHAPDRLQYHIAIMMLKTSISMFKDRRSEEHTWELQALMGISYAVFCLKKKNKN